MRLPALSTIGTDGLVEPGSGYKQLATHPSAGHRASDRRDPKRIGFTLGIGESSGREAGASAARRAPTIRRRQLMIHERPIVAARFHDRPKDSGIGRICAQSECATVLSRYNPETVCGVHTETNTEG